MSYTGNFSRRLFNLFYFSFRYSFDVAKSLLCHHLNTLKIIINVKRQDLQSCNTVDVITIHYTRAPLSYLKSIENGTAVTKVRSCIVNKFNIFLLRSISLIHDTVYCVPGIFAVFRVYQSSSIDTQ